MTPLVFRTRLSLLLMPVFLLLSSLSNARLHPLFLLGVPFCVAYFFVLWRTRTVLTDEGITVGGWRGARLLPWADVTAVRQAGGAVRAVTRDGEQVLLPWVEWRAVLPQDSQYVYAKSGQAVVRWARQAGHEVALEEAPPA